MSTISGMIAHGITLGTTGAYASPLTITSTGYVQGAIYGPNTAAWIVDNAGKVLGVDLANGGSVANEGAIHGAPGGTGVAGGIGINLSGGGIITNTGAIDGGSGGGGPIIGVRYILGVSVPLFGAGGAGSAAMILSGGGGITNGGVIDGGAGGAGAPGGAGGAGIILLDGGSIINAGVIVGGTGGGAELGRTGAGPAGAAGAGIELPAGGTVIDSGTISGGTAITFGGTAGNQLVLEQGYKLVGGVLGSGALGATNTLEISGSLGAVTVSYSAVGLTNFQDVLFGPGGNDTLDVSKTSGTPGVTISGFGTTGDVIDLTAIGTNGTITGQSSTQVTISGSGGTVTLNLDATDGTSFQTTFDGAAGTDLSIVCICRGTLILTERGEVTVEDLVVGDRVATLSGAVKPIRWIGFGRDLVTRRNSLARPIIVRAGALSDGVPRRDLYLTHGHSLYIDGVLIPVENLVNHRSILWDESARVVEYYHIELDDHDVVLAEGAPAESYYDAGNRALFHNTRPGSQAGAARPTFAPVLNGGEFVGRVWAALHERAGGRLERETTDDPDLHLVIDGERLDPISVADCVYSFAVERPPAGAVLLRSRSAVPSLTGISRHDHRRLGVAIRQIIVHGEGIMTSFDHAAPPFREGGCHAAESGHAWTDGELTLPAALFRHLGGAFTLLVQTREQAMRYPILGPARQAASIGI